MNAKSGGNYTMLGLCHGLADAWKSGLFNGIDMHTEFDVEYEPLYGTRTNSMQFRFDQMRERCGLEQVPMELYTTEFGFKVRDTTRLGAAKSLLTAIVDQWTVVNAHPGTCSDAQSELARPVLDSVSAPVATSNQTSICTSSVRMSMPWNVFHNESSDPMFAMAVSDSPYVPSPKGSVFWRALNLTEGFPATFGIENEAWANGQGESITGP